MEGGWSRHRKRAGVESVKRGEGDPGERLKRSVARAKREVTRKCMWAKLDHLVTPTYRANVEDLGQALKDAASFIAEVRKELPEWAYIMAWEIQPDRFLQTGFRVWHLHFGVRGFQNIPILQRAWERVVGVGMGNVDVRMPGVKRGEKHKTTRFGRLKLAQYLAKYIGKNLEDSPLNKKKYWHSANVEAPPVERIPITGSMSGMAEWAKEIFKAAGARVVHVWEHETGLYGYISSF